MSWGNIYKYARDGLPRVLRTLAMTCIKPGMTHGKEIPGQAGGFRGRSPLGEGVESNEVRTRGTPPPPNHTVIPFGHYFCKFIPAGLEFY